MKEALAVFVLCAIIFAMVTLEYKKSIKQKDSIIDSLNIELSKSLTIDTNYMKHLKECSLISKDQLYINDNGFLKVRKVRYLSEN